MYDHRKRPHANDNNPNHTKPHAKVMEQRHTGDVLLAVMGMAASLALISLAVLDVFGPWPY